MTTGSALGDLPVERVAERLAELAGEAAARARRYERPVVASVTFPLPNEIDVAACVFASRTADERYFVWEEPERAFALGGLGSALTVEGVAEPDRFAAVARRAADALQDAVVEDTDTGAEPLSGPVWTGGFSFSPQGCLAPHWSGFPPALMVLPVLMLSRAEDACRVTINLALQPGDDVAGAARAGAARLGALSAASIPLVDPDPLGGYDISSALPPNEYVLAVQEAKNRVEAGQLEKIVLAREVDVTATAPFRPASVFDGLRSGYPSCFCFCVGVAQSAFVGASPELLVRRAGASVASVALAGSTRRSADPAVDDHLGQQLLRDPKEREEQRIVARRIEHALAPLAVWVAAEAEPSLVKVANIQHLGTPVRAQLAEPRSAVELAGALHPTPAVGGEPWDRASVALGELERFDRGWYAGPVGWMDAAEDGEFCVAIRSALLEGRTARCYAGVGVVAGSDPEAELAETETKLQAVLPALIGA